MQNERIENGHLSADQLDDYLIGDLAAEPAAHLAACEHCLARVAEAEAPMASFRNASLAWAERRSATMPSPVSEAARAPKRRLTHVHWLSGAVGLATAAVLVTIALPAKSRDAAVQTAATTRSQPAAAQPAAALPPAHPAAPETLAALGHTGIQSVTPVAASPEQIDRDNQMLEAISRELDAPQGADSFGLVAAARGR